jgi:hypothetical protein
MNKCIETIPLPDGLKIGQRIRTTKRYAICHLRAPGPFGGTILGGSRSQDGPVTVKLDHQIWAKPQPLVWIEVVE